ncbi:hypothetical protein N0V90_005064 [Kalmusia sp. IMI 367209]|nr:hypothetical protein N0V90_005064 [Kalmusia sp. IMI 367209]
METLKKQKALPNFPFLMLDRNYWLWSTTLGGQVPCYSSLAAKMTPPPIPDTLVAADGAPVTDREGNTITGTDENPFIATTSAVFASRTSGRVPALTLSQKPTSAIVNIAYAMQYPMVPPPKPALKPGAKIGIGVGASAAAILIAVLVWLLARKLLKRQSTRKELRAFEQSSVSQRFGSGVDMSRVAHEPAGVGRVFGGKKYAGVSTAAVNY